MKKAASLAALASRFRRGAWFEEFPTFAAAAAASKGYEDGRIVDVVRRKTQRLLESPPGPLGTASLQTALTIALASRGAPVKVVELGGGCGATFLEVERFLPELIARWTIVETEAMADAGRSSFASERLRFGSSLDDVDPDDGEVVIAQGVLQYTDDPPGVLRSLAALSPRYMSIERTLTSSAASPVYLSQSTPLRDHGPGSGIAPEGTATVPLTLVSYGELLDAIEATHRVVLELEPGPEIGAGSTTARERGFVATSLTRR